MKLNNKKKGFTLVELLVVIAIIAILSAISMIIFTNVQKSARTAKRVADLKAISTAVEMYYTVNGAYPVTRNAVGTLGAFYSECSGSTSWITQSSDQVIPGLVPDYMAKFPADPSMNIAGGNSCYLYASNGTDYAILNHSVREFSDADYLKYPALIDRVRDGGVEGVSPCVLDVGMYPGGKAIWAWKIYSPGYICK